MPKKDCSRARARTTRALSRYLSAAVALAALSAEGVGLAQKPAVPAADVVTPIEVKLQLTRLTLDNGLRVVLNVDRTSPTVAVAVAYDVGARNEEKGRSGFAHLFEHMMFQGSKNVGKGEHLSLVAGHGGTANGTTSPDRTGYYEVLPSSELALGLWLEADRMASLSVTKEHFENQRDVVKEEYRMRVSNAAYAPAALRLEELVYQGYAPYEHPAVGSLAELDVADFAWVKEFHAKYYGPNNAVLSIAGDFDEEEAKALIHKYFDKIAKVTTPAFADSVFPEQASPRTGVLRDAHAGSPAMLFGWRAPKMGERAAYALELLAIVLGEGESSRLYQLLVRDRAAALDVSARMPLRRGPGMFEIDAKLAPKAKVLDVQKLVEDAVKALGDKGPTAAELAKAQRRAQSRFVFGLQTNGARARRLADEELFFGDAGRLPGEPSRYLAIGIEDVQKAVKQYLLPTKRTVVEVYPLEDEKPAAAGSTKGAADSKKAGSTKGATGTTKAGSTKPGAKKGGK
ncbi:MAG: pitrilysin family protein [Polyangiaceae bacterium]